MDPTSTTGMAITVATAVKEIGPLLKELIEQVKDGKAAGLVQQIQTHQQTIQSAYFEAKQEAIKLASDNFDLKREIAKIQDAHANEMATLKEHHAAEIAKFRKPQAPTKPDLTKEELYIIGLMARREGKTTLEALASGLNCPITKAKYHADNLRRLGLIRLGPHLPEGQMYALTEEGERFAVEKGLI